MANFNHFIITRFNLRQTIWEHDKSGNSLNNEIWLEERFAVFETYCYPSIKSQTNKQFKWLVYFDTDTPISFKQRNEQLKNEFENYMPIYISSFSEFQNTLPQTILGLLNNDAEYVITTRIDNDDAFHKDAVKAIQDSFVEKDKTIVDLVNGLALQIKKPNKLSLKKNVVSGPFISLIEKKELYGKLLTVYNREHTSWHSIASYVSVKENYYWLQIIHSRNISNGLSNELTFNKKYLKGYNFIKPIKFNFRYYVFIILKRLKLIRLIKQNLLKN